ncbi:MAG: hypothetical protein EOO96_00615 [Pedobacter sp.]|nr:MAG: hypothetical protein EOO96_00615 [Pedobacter sp.]
MAVCLSLLFSTTISYAQVNFYKSSVGFGLGPNVSYADVRENSMGFAAYLSGDYNFTPFVTAGLEIQAGQLKGGDIITNPHNRQFKNNFKAVSLNAKVALGEFIKYERSDFLSAIKGLYIGTGIGAINNNMKYVVRYKPNTQAEYPPLGYEFPGKNKSTNLLVPVSAGINFYLFDTFGDMRYILNFGYQGNITFGEGLDGYDDPMAVFENDSPDMYALFSVGIKYNFGSVGLTKRRF